MSGCGRSNRPCLKEKATKAGGSCGAEGPGSASPSAADRNFQIAGKSYQDKFAWPARSPAPVSTMPRSFGNPEGSWNRDTVQVTLHRLAGEGVHLRSRAG